MAVDETTDGANLRPKTTAAIVERLRGTPGALYSILGLAFSICALEVHRYPMVQSVPTDGAPYTSLFTVLAMLALALFYHVSGSRVLQKPAVTMGAALVNTALLYIYCTAGYDQSLPESLRIASQLFAVPCALIFANWAAVLYRRPAAEAAVTFIASLAVVFCLQLACGVLSADVIKGTYALFPCFSALFYMLYHHARKGAYDLLPLDGLDAEGDAARRADAHAAPTPRAGYALSAVETIACGMLFAHLHALWLPTQGHLGPFSIQLFTALGTLVAAIALALVTPLPGRRISTMACQSLMLAFVIFSIYLSTYRDGTVSALYLTPFNAAQKVLLYFIFGLCLALAAPSRRICGFCLLYAALRSSNLLYGPIAGMTVGMSHANDIVVVASLVVIIVTLVATMARPSLFPSLPSAGRDSDNARADERASGSQEELEYYKSVAFYFLFGQKYVLTQREVELLPLLMHRQGAKAIAETLSISQATAKTHIRNIYGKLGAHTQDELVALVERERASLFDQLPSWYLGQ